MTRYLIASPHDTDTATASAATREGARLAMLTLSREQRMSFTLFGPLFGDPNDPTIPPDLLGTTLRGNR